MLNRATQDNPLDEYERIVDGDMEFEVGEIRKEEVKEAIEKITNEKAPGVDQITADD